MSFYDLENNPLTAYEQTMSPAQTIVFQIQADCKAGKFLRCEAAGEITIEGRFSGVGDFVDLVAEGLDTSAFDGEKKIFDIRATAAVDWEDLAIENAVFQIKS